MFSYIQNIPIMIIEILCCVLFFDTFSDKRKGNHRWINCGIVVAMIMGGYLLAIVLPDSFLLRQAAVILFIAILMKGYFNVTLRKSLVLSTLFQSLLLIVDYFAIIIHLFFLQEIEYREEMFSMRSYLIVALGKVILFLTIIIIRKYMGKDKVIIFDNIQWLRLVAFPLFTICIIAKMIKIFGKTTGQEQENLFFIIAYGLAGLNIVVFYFIRDMARRETEICENKIFKLKVGNQIEMYRSISENFNKQNKKTHEYKNQIMCISTLIKKKNYIELEKYVDEISGKLDKKLDFICTNNVIIDAVLNNKYQEIREKKIVFVLKINDLANIFIRDEDIVIILANLLNNAIEACEKCDREKVIKLKFVYEDDSIIISVKNTHRNAINYVDNEIQTSKKEETEEHGIGIKNIVEIIDKYEGSYVIQNDEKEFYFSILIPQKNYQFFG